MVRRPGPTGPSTKHVSSVAHSSKAGRARVTRPCPQFSLPDRSSEPVGLMDFIKRLLGGWTEEPFPDAAVRRGGPYGRRARRARRRTMSQKAQLGLMDLSRRLRLTASSLQSAPVRYNEFTIPKRSGGPRTILAPEPDLKELQRRRFRAGRNSQRARTARQRFLKSRRTARGWQCRSHAGGLEVRYECWHAGRSSHPSSLSHAGLQVVFAKVSIVSRSWMVFSCVVSDRQRLDTHHGHPIWRSVHSPTTEKDDR